MKNIYLLCLFCLLISCGKGVDRSNVEGTISGLAGSGLVLQNGMEKKAINANGALSFATPRVSGATYNVVVHTQPTSPAQSCFITSGTGTVDWCAAIDVGFVPVAM